MSYCHQRHCQLHMHTDTSVQTHLWSQIITPTTLPSQRREQTRYLVDSMHLSTTTEDALNIFLKEFSQYVCLDRGIARLFLCLPVCLVCLSVCLPCLSVRPSICLVCPSVRPSVCLSDCLPVCLSFCLFLCLSIRLAVRPLASVWMDILASLLRRPHPN